MPELQPPIQAETPLLDQRPPYHQISSPQLRWRPSTQPQTTPGKRPERNRNQETKHPSNKDKLKNQHLDLQSAQAQMPSHQGKNTTNNHNSQGSMSPPKPSYCTTPGPEYSNTDESQENNLKPTFGEMLEILKEGMNNPPEELEKLG